MQLCFVTHEYRQKIPKLWHVAMSTGRVLTQRQLSHSHVSSGWLYFPAYDSVLPQRSCCLLNWLVRLDENTEHGPSCSGQLDGWAWSLMLSPPSLSLLYFSSFHSCAAPYMWLHSRPPTSPIQLMYR